MSAVPERSPQPRVAAVIASPNEGGSTSTAVRAMLEGCVEQGAHVDVVSLSGGSHADALSLVALSDAIILASPTYRSTHTSLLSGFLELIGRDPTNTEEASLTGKVTSVLMTGASSEHFMASMGLLQILTCFFGAQVLSPPLYFDRSAFHPSGQMHDQPAELAREHGRALVDLAVACMASRHLSGLRPLI